MTPDLYDPCPCGSGKKFKWCCQPIYVGIGHALDQEASGQHELALRTIDQVVKDHPGNPEAWGQRARLLYVNGQPEQAEEALQKAFDINPTYPFGLRLRAEFRLNEGEIPGALLLARRAADAYDPAARDQLASVYWIIFQCEDKLHRPVAARAALRLVLHYQPANEELRQTFEGVFGEQSPFPLSARREYRFLSPPTSAAPEQRATWERILGNSTNSRFSEAARAFEAITTERPDDRAAWFNLGLSQAWLGDNVKALASLDRYIELEPDEAAAADAATLGEVLRLGYGLEEQADYHEYALVCPLHQAEPVNALLNEWAQARRLLPLQSDQQNSLVALLLDVSPSGLVTVGRPAADVGKLAGYLLIANNLFQLTSPFKEPFDRLKAEVRQRLGLGLGELHERTGPGQFREVTAEALIFPTQKDDNFAEKALDHAARYYEDTWIHRPRRSLSGISPIDAVGSAKLRKKVRGIVQFIAECAEEGMLKKYDFDRLRRKLNLNASPAAPAGTTATPADISALGAGELATLDLQQLSDDQLEQAYQTAHRLNAEELTGHFAQALVSRPGRTEKPDRYPWFSYLIQKALREGDTTAALDQVNEGERQDCEQNGGKRRNDYELRRAQVHVKRGEADNAHDVYVRLIERVPDNLTYRGDAAEAMLRLKQPAKAAKLAEAGLEKARRQNDRDNEGRLQDLLAAAKRQGG